MSKFCSASRFTVTDDDPIKIWRAGKDYAAPERKPGPFSVVSGFEMINRLTHYLSCIKLKLASQ